MPLTELNHYFVRANDLEKTKDFYVGVLGFEVMPRPNFPFPGYWLGVNGREIEKTITEGHMIGSGEETAAAGRKFTKRAMPY